MMAPQRAASATKRQCAKSAIEPEINMTDQGKGVVKTRIAQKLTKALAPAALNVIDESHSHAGHGHHHPDGETHFRVEVVSAAFEGKSLIERHRLVNALLSDELADRVHALAISAKTPHEAAPV
jgi:BolA protein